MSYIKDAIDDLINAADRARALGASVRSCDGLTDCEMSFLEDRIKVLEREKAGLLAKIRRNKRRNQAAPVHVGLHESKNVRKAM